MPTPESITITAPDDWHLHLRDGSVLASVLPHTARRFRRAIVMPNLSPPVTTTELADAYRQRIIAACPDGLDFTPLMTLYLTDNTAAEDIRLAAASGFVHGVKLYPAGATTNSDHGVTRLENTWPALEAMTEVGLPLLVHGEVTAPDVDVYDREARFIDAVLAPLKSRFADLRVVFEHVTTAQAVQFVQATPRGLAATITPQHLLYNRTAMFQGGLQPHLYCLPVLKREMHREALVQAATSGDARFFLGTDSAPHAVQAKQSACGCAGVYSAHAGLEFYAKAFEDANCLHRLEAFASFHGADFYGLHRNTDTITLTRQPWQVPHSYALGNDRVVPLMAGEQLDWRLAGAELE